MNPITSPAWMTAINAIGVIYGGLETSGVINLLGNSKWGGVAVLAITALNGVAHAFSPPSPGPLNDAPIPAKTK